MVSAKEAIGITDEIAEFLSKATPREKDQMRWMLMGARMATKEKHTKEIMVLPSLWWIALNQSPFYCF